MDNRNRAEENSQQDASSDGRRAAHVKWDGKTIALGTFSAAEAAEKCERAKALTKKWRATMVPKPDVEWVKKALERLHIRVVNDRPGRRKKNEIFDRDRNKMSSAEQMFLPPLQRSEQGDPSMRSFSQQYNLQGPNDVQRNPYSGMPNARRFSNASGAGVAQRCSPLQQTGSNPPSTYDSRVPRNNYPLPQSRAGMQAPSNFAVDNLSGILPPNLSGNSRHHYQILKEHHDNLLKELQQTTYMMEMYKRSFEDRSQQEQENANMIGRQGGMFPNSMNNPPVQRRPSFPLRQTAGYASNIISNANPYFPIDYNGRRPSWGIGELDGGRMESYQGGYVPSAAPNRSSQYPQNQGNLNINERMSQIGPTQNQSQSAPAVATNTSRGNSNRRHSHSSSSSAGLNESAKRSKIAKTEDKEDSHGEEGTGESSQQAV